MKSKANVDWGSLPFGYYKTDYNVRASFIDGKWSDYKVFDSEYVDIHMAATCLHYGQEIFEGMKAFEGVDGVVRLFRPEENLKRIQDSARGLLMEPIPSKLFLDMVKEVVKLNQRFIPPYETGSSFYVRPVEIGITPRVGVQASIDYQMIIFGSPVGPYFKTGFQPTKVAIFREYDRVAPCGTGRFKTGGNYAGSLKATARARGMGYSAVLFLDPKEKLYLDECGPANFFGVRGNSYITPKSHSILPSITNKSLQQLAADNGMTIECRQVPFEEIATFDEAAECGAAAVIAPISQIDDLDENKSYVIAKDGKPGPVCEKLYHQLRAIQYGDAPDPYNWVTVIE